jgi:glucosamine kinase
MTDYFVGVDAGGTHCRASLYDSAETVIGTGLAGPANVFSHFTEAMQQIDIAVDLAVRSANIAIDKKSLIVGAGCAGGQTTQAREGLKRLNVRYKQLFLTSDLHASCLAANSGGDCVVLITGTGSSIAHYQNGLVTQYGGYGFTHGDEASGAWLGLRAVQLLLKSFDNLVDDEEFCSAIAHTIGIDYMSGISNANKSVSVDHILGYFKGKLATDYAKLAPIIIGLYENGNSTANTLINEGANYLSSVLSLNVLGDDFPIFITGGIARSYHPLLQQKMGKPVFAMQRVAQDGAMLYAKLQMNSSPTTA